MARNLKIQAKPSLVPLLLLYLLIILPIIVQGVLMGFGPFPKVFFNVDSPYHLQHIISLTKHNIYPPPSLQNLGEQFHYHYGLHGIAAFLSDISNVKPHQILFLVLIPVIITMKFLMTIALFRRHGVMDKTIAVLVVFFGLKQYWINYFDRPTFLWTLFSVEKYEAQYPSMTTEIGSVCLLAILLCLTRFEQQRFRVLSVFLVGTLPLFKLPYSALAGIGFAGFCFLNYLKSREKHMLIYPVLAAALMIAVYMAFTKQSVGIDMQLGFNGIFWMSESNLAFYCYIIPTTLIFLLMKNSRKHFPWQIFPFVIVLPIVVSFIQTDSRDFWQVSEKVSLLSAIFFLTYFFRVKNRFGKASIIFIYTYMAFLTGPSIVSYVNYTKNLITQPSSGHEYVNNEALADALSGIEVEKSILVTNDLRYPANNYLRKTRQLQFPSIFGHQNYGVNMDFKNDENFDYTSRELELKLFSELIWNKRKIAELVQQNRITHLIIHKKYPHADSIPLAVTYDNDTYRVYKFTYQNVKDN
ncbi:MAG: hypothetical protein H6602_13010 [Flavobacteriales bacterium]|nr:hypothetical protein [Flavobacteriales bacterium]